MRSRFLLTAVLIAVGLGGSTAKAAGSGNPRNDKLLAVPESDRGEVLGKILGHGCVGVDAFPMGVMRTGRAKGAAYWSVRCQNGKSYAIEFPPNPKIRAPFVECQQLEGTGHECFKKF